MKGHAGKRTKVTGERWMGIVHRVYLCSGRAGHYDGLAGK
jgi:hypothetical protein